MSPRLGALNYSTEEGGYLKPYSNKTGRIIDEEIKRIIDECYDRCKAILTEKKFLIEKYFTFIKSYNKLIDLEKSY